MLDELTRELVLQAQQGDRSAFDTLYTMHSPRVFAYCARLLGNREHGEEVAQEVWKSAWIKRDQFRFESPFENWLIRIATNMCRNRFRTTSGQGEIQSVSLDQPETVAVVGKLQSVSEMEAEILRRDFHQYLLRTIRQSAATNRPIWDVLDWSIFYLLYEENISEAREIARRLNRSEDTVKYRIYKRINVTLRRVREILDTEEASLQQSSQASVS